MRLINKTSEPPSLTDWKRKNPGRAYKDFDNNNKEDIAVRQKIREEALKEQFYLCAYCCQSISEASCHNEHVEAQHPNGHNSARSLDFSNIVTSCNTPKQCGDAHGNQSLPLTPLMPECEAELRFKISGRVEGLTEQATESIRILNLGDNERNNRSLVEKRKRLVGDLLLWKHGVDPNEGLEDPELLEMLIMDLSQPQGGKLESFAPVVINILRNWL